jgi:hypothetical protein
LDLKLLGPKLCALAWTVAVATQIVFMLRTPDHAVLFGTDWSDVIQATQRRGLLFVGLGLLTAAVGLITGRFGFLVSIGSAFIYLTHWFPMTLIARNGFGGALVIMRLADSIPGLRMTGVIRDLILPVAFVVSIALCVLEWRRSYLNARSG